MADVFIGYARRNRDTIEQLASAIEVAGYSVWWDRNIIGGAEFSRDIERELDAARAVVIAWSGDASDSPWAKDEAAFARDQGKLLPISLDSGIPPMGFRQYQAVDFSGWNGKPDHPAMEGLLRAIKALLEGSAPPSLAQPTGAPPRRKLSLLQSLGAFAMLALLVAIAAYQFKADEGDPTAASDPAETERQSASVQNQSEPRIAVSAIRVRGAEPTLQDLAATLTEDISSGLSRFSYLLVSARLDRSRANVRPLIRPIRRQYPGERVDWGGPKPCETTPRPDKNQPSERRVISAAETHGNRGGHTFS